MLGNSDGKGHSCFVPDLSGNFEFLTVKSNANFMVFIDVLNQVQKVLYS